MQKRLLLIAMVLALCSLPFVSAVVYGQSSGIVRSTTLPSENVHAEAQQQQTIVAAERINALESRLAGVDDQLNNLRASSESQRADITNQLGNLHREVGAVKGSVDSLQGIQQQVSELRPAIEQPREIIPPVSLLALSVGNAILLIIVIVLIFWLKAQWKSSETASHLEEHAQIHLTDFIREAMHKGASMEEIRKRLLQRGWSDSRIDEAIQEVRTMHAG
jgi:hypothetical protein